MTSVGEALRRERLRRGQDLEDIARDIKIRAKLLEFIEADQFDRLPGGVFAKSFVKQYASALGLDGDEFAAEVQRQIQPTPAAMPEMPRAAAAKPVAQTERTMTWQSIGEERSSSPWMAFAIVVAVIVACSFAYNWWASRQTETAERQSPSSAPAAPAASRPREHAAPAPLPEPSATRVEPAPEPFPARAESAAPAAPAVDPNAPVRVTLTASEDTWVSAQSDGKGVFAATLTANETRSVAAQGAVKLIVGNAGGLAVNLNGKPIGPLGPRGQVRVVQFTPSGAEIQAREPAPAPIRDVL
jgi:cytoskeleton protein RodZ